MAVMDYVDNQTLRIDPAAPYAAIIGESPSMGARSPALWNATFQAFGIGAAMHPMDVTGSNLGALMAALRDDGRFIGGAVTMPHKVAVMAYLDELEPEAERIGAVNCIYRRGDGLVGANTDGAGALATLQAAVSRLDGMKVLLLGTGGVGAAAAVYVARALGPTGTLYLANRTRAARDNLAQRIGLPGVVQLVETWPVREDVLDTLDVLINCTDIGFGAMRTDEGGRYTTRFVTPLGNIPEVRSAAPESEALSDYIRKAAALIADNIQASVRALSLMKNSLVFDVIYQPKTTMLLSLAARADLKTLNGLPMNLEQAVIAFHKATHAAGIWAGDERAVRDVMSKTLP
jgi:shikimate dehydrogenase